MPLDNPQVTRVRADVLLVERGLAETRERAQRLIMAGRARIGTRTLVKPATLVDFDAAIELTEPERYVSRGGYKLEGALVGFEIDVTGRRCLDIGASTGGFTDCLLQRGAASVLAIDVGRAQLHQRLRDDPRVTLLEGTNARALPELPAVDLFVADLSFISLRKVLPSVAERVGPCCEGVVLLKPQFEAGPSLVPRGGVISRPQRARNRAHGLYPLGRRRRLVGLWHYGVANSRRRWQRGVPSASQNTRPHAGNAQFAAMLSRAVILHHPQSEGAAVFANQLSRELGRHGVGTFVGDAWGPIDEAAMDRCRSRRLHRWRWHGLRAARLTIPYAVPILGVNMGRLGFLTDMSPRDCFTNVERILEEDWRVEERLMARGELEVGPIKPPVVYHGLNDIVSAVNRRAGRSTSMCRSMAPASRTIAAMASS